MTQQLPNGNPGSGLTVIVGANNSGKSTVVEALRALSQKQEPSFTQGRRNQAAGDQVHIRITDIDGNATVLKSSKPGGSETEILKEKNGVDLSKLFLLPARRIFSPYFNRASLKRDAYMDNIGFPAIRSSTLEQFSFRLFEIEKNRAKFDQLLGRVLDPVPDWTIDQTDTGQYFLKIKVGQATHSSEGMGEGLVSLMYIIDALYDSSDGDTIVIDEPELSLHPALQRKLSDLLLEYSASRQLIIATHSPYFANLRALPNGGTVTRVHIVSNESRLSQLSLATAQKIFGLMRNQNNPHLLGLVAQEVFFLEDKVILVEGQEDVIFFEKVQNDTEYLRGEFFGWGVGGAENMEHIATVLQELGFSKVVGILDGNRLELSHKLAAKFPGYHFFSIPANDIRTKEPTSSKPAVKGLLDDSNNVVRKEYLAQTRQLIALANQYLLR